MLYRILVGLSNSYQVPTHELNTRHRGILLVSVGAKSRELKSWQAELRHSPALVMV